MASEEMGLVSTQRTYNNLNPQLLFQDENPLRFGCSAPHRRGVGDPDPKTRDLDGFMDDKLFTVDHRDRYFSPEARRGGVVFGEGPASDRRSSMEGRNWNGSGPTSTPSSGEEDEEEEEDDDEEEEEDEGEGDREVEGLAGIDSSGNGGKNSHVSSAIGEKIEVGNSKNNSSFGSSTRQMIMKDGSLLQTGADVNRVSSSDNGHQGRVWHFQKMVTIAEHDGYMYYSQLQGIEGSSQGHKDIPGENGCGFSGRKENSVFSDHGESLRAIFSDPITGALMDDAMILPCGHSFGCRGIEQVIKLKACYSCSHPVAEDSVAPNISLRVAVQAFLREEDILMYRASKRRRERFEQDQGNYGDSSFSDTPRGRGVQFPFSVTDRVVIKGNKRTPQRFVGREAIVTTQCLNGWYVVKTLDNAESVKLQYRSLEKVPDNPSSKPMSMPAKMTPNWL